ncbi:MAG: GNAT family N-acetyltransferase, partial [Methanothrix sp.]|nr:GNAT family N-acetyltransferase [Methanothrix sp.]
AEKESEIVAVAAALDDKVALLWVHPDHQRNGIGGALLDIVEAELAKSGHETAKLECFSDNDRALGFYHARGWNVLCQEMDEYAGALKMVMTKTLKKDVS